MDFLLPLSCMLLFLALVFFLAHPLLAERQPASLAAAGEAGRALNERKEQLYAALVELEFDRDLGKVSAADFERLRRGLEEEALEVMRRLDQLNGHARSQALEEQLEARVQTLRQAPQTRVHCPSCEAEHQPGDRFCARCGNRLSGAD